MGPSCREVAEQLSKNIDQPIKGFKGLMLKLHLKMCCFCRQYDDQIKLCSKTIDALNEKKTQEQSPPSPELMQKVALDYRKVHEGNEKDTKD